MSRRFPVPPGVVGRVVKAAADPETTLMDLAGLISKDVVISAQMLKTVNSAYYGLRQKVSTIDRAISLMGIRAVRNLVLSLGIKDLVPSESLGEFPMDQFWEASLRRGAAAQCIGKELGLPQAEELFTLSLSQDLGVLLNAQENREFAEGYAKLFSEMSESRLTMERKTCTAHDELGSSLFREWEFPDELCTPIEYHHSPEDAPQPFKVRAQVANVAEDVADLLQTKDPQAAMEHLKQKLEAIGLSEKFMVELVNQVKEIVTEFAEVLGLKVAEQPDYQQIVSMASEGLVNLTLSYEEATKRLEQALREQERMAKELEKRSAQLEQQAMTDGLTGLPNRRSFDADMLRTVSQSQRQGKPFSVVLIDVDKFKNFNDTHGHQAGDLVLQKVGKSLMDAVRTGDIPARYGGEEFAVILPFTDKEGSKVAADRIRQSIEDMNTEWQGQVLKVTASFGGHTIRQFSERQDVGQSFCESLLRSADKALYEAKEAGRNRVCWS